MKHIEIIPIKKPLNSEIQIPGSKSITNRAFLIAALAKGKTLIKNPLLSDDTKYMIKALKNLGIKINKLGNNFLIHGQDGNFKKPDLKYIYLGNAGTAVRFLTASLALQKFPITITGNKRMRQRPIKDLIDGLNQLGADVHSIKNNDCPPLKINKPLIGGICEISGQKSSQFFSALLLSAPYAKKNITIKTKDELVSKPYINQTIEIMKDFGIKLQNINYKEFKIKANQKYIAQEYEVEADASSATYFAAIAALTQSRVKITNLNANSVQADINFLKIIKKMGAKIETDKKGITILGSKQLKPLGKINLNHMPDGAMTIAVLCACAKGKSILTGLENLRIKETDRLKALKTELSKINCNVKETPDGLIINGDPDKLKGAVIETYDDHRMAMCFAVLGAKIPEIKIKDPSCVNKTYPNFWKDLQKTEIKTKKDF